MPKPSNTKCISSFSFIQSQLNNDHPKKDPTDSHDGQYMRKKNKIIVRILKTSCTFYIINYTYYFTLCHHKHWMSNMDKNSNIIDFNRLSRHWGLVLIGLEYPGSFHSQLQRLGCLGTLLKLLGWRYSPNSSACPRTLLFLRLGWRKPSSQPHSPCLEWSACRSHWSYLGHSGH